MDCLLAEDIKQDNIFTFNTWILIKYIKLYDGFVADSLTFLCVTKDKPEELDMTATTMASTSLNP